MAENADSGTGQIEVALGVIEQGGKVLICRRPKEAHLGDYWEFPGGKRRPGEAWEDCLVRELQEELGVVVEPGREMDSFVFEYPERRISFKAFACCIREGVPRALSAAELAWVDREGLSRFRFPPANGPLLEKLLGG